MAGISSRTQSEWELQERYDTLLREATLKHVDTIDVRRAPIHHAETKVITSTIKSSDEVIGEMKSWLRTGITPDGTRMMTDEVWQWYHDYYQCTGGEDDEAMPVDYYYWHAPFYAHIGEIPLVMMHAQVNLIDGTHFPADRLSKRTKMSKNVPLKAAKRVEVDERTDKEFVAKAMEDFKAHPLRKKGVFSRMFG